MYASQQSQIARQATDERHSPLPTAVLEGIAKYEGTAPDAERLFNSLTTHLAMLGTSIAGLKTNMADMSENVKVMKSLKERVATLERTEAVNNLHTKFFIEQAICLALDYANGKGFKIDFGQVQSRLEVNMALNSEGSVAAADGSKGNEKNEQKLDEAIAVARTAATAAAPIPIIVERAPESMEAQTSTPAPQTKNVQSSTPAYDPYEKPSEDEFDDSDEEKPIMKIRTPKSKSAPSAKPDKGKGKASVLSSSSPAPAPAPVKASSPIKAPEVAAPVPWTNYGQEALDEAKAFMSTASRGGSKSSRGTQGARSAFAAPPARSAATSAVVRPTAPAFHPDPIASTTDESRFPFRAKSTRDPDTGASGQSTAVRPRQGMEASMWAPKNFRR